MELLSLVWQHKGESGFMSSATRRSFLMLTGGSVAALSMGTDFLDARQLPGQSRSETSGWQDGNFSNVMAIAAHPGDVFFAMGAPVAVATHFGGQGSLLSLSLGEKGSRIIPAAQYGSSQREAAQKGAELLSAKALFLQYPDGEIPINDEAKFAVCDLIRQYKPLTIVTHWKGSWHKDHRACYDIVEDAIFLRWADRPRSERTSPSSKEAMVCRQLGRCNWLYCGYIPGYNFCIRSMVECM
jgi:hypothetical protein